MSNPFDVLGNDVEEPTQVVSPREIVKKNTSSKKQDVAPTTDKKRSNKTRTSPTGNEAAYRDKSAGRNANKSKPTEPAVVAAKKGGKPKTSGPNDRKSKTGKTDSAKKLKQAGWTDKDAERELETEVAAAEDVEEEIEEEVEEDKGPAKKTLKEYLAELELSKEIVETPVATGRVIEAPAGAKIIAKTKEDFISASTAKKEGKKSRKEKQVLEFSAVFSDEVPRRNNDGRRGGFRGGRGGSRGGRGGSRGGKQPVAKTTNVLDTKKFPSLT